MNKQSIINAVNALFAENDKNVIGRDAAIRPDLAGVKLFEQPLIEFGSAADFPHSKPRVLLGPGSCPRRHGYRTEKPSSPCSFPLLRRSKAATGILQAGLPPYGFTAG